MSSPLITLTTDFGLADEYVGVMKGVILSINPAVKIVDITHHIRPQDLHGAAYAIGAAYRYFPAGSIHVCVVDPGVGTGREILAVSMAGQVFLAPNNGILSRVMKADPMEAAVRVENGAYFRHPVSRTFHGRDIFSPVAAHLTTGVPMGRLGPVFEHARIARLSFNDPSWSAGKGLSGEVIWEDRFGNLGTNIHRDLIDEHFGQTPRNRLVITLGGIEIQGLCDSYLVAGQNKPLAIIGSRDYLELAVCCGHAGRFFRAKKADSVRLFAKPAPPEPGSRD